LVKQFAGKLDMPEAQSGLSRTAAHLHSAMKAAADGVGILLVDGFHYLALFAIGATTVSALAAFCEMFAKGRAELSDILCLFISRGFARANLCGSRSGGLFSSGLNTVFCCRMQTWRLEVMLEI
jgi:hypothetical protein